MSTTLKLSEAIRLGARLKPQGRTFLTHDGRTCAVGAALDVCGRLDADAPESKNWHVAEMLWPWAAVVIPERIVHPVTGQAYGATALRLITSLNDLHDWTREQIADWVATIEPQDAPSEAKIETVKVSA